MLVILNHKKIAIIMQRCISIKRCECKRNEIWRNTHTVPELKATKIEDPVLKVQLNGGNNVFLFLSAH